MDQVLVESGSKGALTNWKPLSWAIDIALCRTIQSGIYSDKIVITNGNLENVMIHIEIPCLVATIKVVYKVIRSLI